MKKLLLTSAIFIFSFNAFSQGLWQANGSNIVHTSRLVGINTSNPSQQLEVNGSIKMTDGNQGAGKLFTSDAGGVGSWQTPIWIIDNNIIVNNYDTRDMQVFGTFMPLGFPNIAGNGTSLDIAGDKTNINQARINFDPANGVLNFYAGTPAGNPPSMTIDNGQIRINGNPLQQSQWSTNPDSSISFNGNVFVKNLNASESINIGTFRFSNGGANPLPVIIDSIRTPFPMTISSGANQIRLDADTLHLGDRVAIDPSPVAGNVRLSVQGDIAATGNLRLSNLADTSGNRMLAVDANGNLKTIGGSMPVPVGCTDIFWRLDGNSIPPICFPFIGTTNVFPLIFKTDANERMRITATGNVGIGTTTPQQMFEVKGGNFGTFGRFGNNNGSVDIGFNGINASINANQGGLLLNYYSNKDVVIGGSTSDPSDISADLSVTGNINVGLYNDAATGTIKMQSANPKLEMENTVDFVSSTIQPANGYTRIRSNRSAVIFLDDDNNECCEDFRIVTNSSFFGPTSGTGVTKELFVLRENGDADLCGMFRAPKIRIEAIGCDFVFEDNYQRMAWQEKELFYKIHKRLPYMESAAKMESEGLDVGTNFTALLQNVEEDRLDITELYKLVSNLQIENEKLKNEILQLKKK